MAKTVLKKAIVVASDHRGTKVHHAVVDFLRERGREVISLADTHENDSYADIVRAACAYIDRGLADSAVLIDQFGSAVASVANMFFGIVAMNASSPYMAHEITRKNNPDVLCIPSEGHEGGVVSGKRAVAIVKEWLDTEFLEDVPAAERAKYEGRDDENRRIHLGIIDGLIGRRHVVEMQSRRGGRPAGSATDILGHYDECFEDD